MADVRLTATNPEDSTVVPVACNAKGELKLEEIPDQSFDGNLDGDLTVSGTADFAGTVSVGAEIGFNAADSTISAVGYTANCENTADLYFRGTQEGVGKINITPRGIWLGNDLPTNGAGPAVFIQTNGNASFDYGVGAGSLQAEGYPYDARFPSLYVTADTSEAKNSLVIFTSGPRNQQPRVVFNMLMDGTVFFAGNKAGFTAEGYFWCTTRRGQTVILDATSNGMGVWEDYTPSNYSDNVQETLDHLKAKDAARAEKNASRPKPEESSQDGPATPQ